MLNCPEGLTKDENFGPQKVEFLVKQFSQALSNLV